uniref:Sugar transporter SWEET n=1 Tax=Oryzias latipes TaxID=8090 RepID=A0A3P9KKS4_ORYLA
MDFLLFLSWACIVFTVGMFSTGLSDLRKMRESKSAENIQFLPFLTTCLNNLGWLFYGILKKDHTIVFVNIIGALLQILYIVMYFYYTKMKRQVTLQTLAAGATLITGWLYFTTFLTEGEARLNQLGLTCSVVTVSMYLSPLFDLVEIVRSRNVQCLSFPLTVATFFTSTSWVLYGLQLNDYYIMVPNTPGIFTSLIRFYLFWKFAPINQSSPTYKALQISMQSLKEEQNVARQDALE